MEPIIPPAQAEKNKNISTPNQKITGFTLGTKPLLLSAPSWWHRWGRRVIVLGAVLAVVAIAILVNNYTNINIFQESYKTDLAKCGDDETDQLKTSCEDSYFNQSAIESHDESLCLEISSEGQQEDCLFNASIGMALSSDDPSVCDNLDYLSKKNECLLEFYFNKAIFEKNSSFCDKSGQYIESCYIRYNEFYNIDQ